jgi:arsenite-transporting ATPase
MNNQKLVINGVFRSSSDDETARAWEKRSQTSLANQSEAFIDIDYAMAPMLPFSPLGAERLRGFWQVLLGKPVVVPPAKQAENKQLPPPLSELLNDIEKIGKGVVMTMGKGGVGKTTLATELAKHLVQHNHKVLLATTDPAAHLDFSLGQVMENLTVSRIDPKEETRKYTEKVMNEAGQHLDEQGKKLLAEDLRSPCTEEIAVFQAFVHLVDQGEDKFIVLDTAPTGHTLLLLDAARAYHREVERTTQELPENVQKLLPRMRDPDFTKILIVTLPELTPIQEARQLEADLERAGIITYAWIINQSLAPLDLSDPLLVTKQQEEFPHIHELIQEKGPKVFISKWA